MLLILKPNIHFFFFFSLFPFRPSVIDGESVLDSEWPGSSQWCQAKEKPKLSLTPACRKLLRRPLLAF